MTASRYEELEVLLELGHLSGIFGKFSTFQIYFTVVQRGWGDALQKHSGDAVHMNDSTNNLPRFSTKSFH